MFGFEKNERANISENELEALKLLAGDLLAMTESQISLSVSKGALLEVLYETQKSSS